MAKLRHVSVGGQLAQTEWESEAIHAIGDIAFESVANTIAWSDIVLSRIAANILGLAAGDSFRIPSDGEHQFAPISPGTQVVAVKSERYNGWAGGISTTYDALQIAGVSGLKARFFQDARLHIWDTATFLSSAPANPADNATFAFAIYGDILVGDYNSWTEPVPGSGTFSALLLGRRIGASITTESNTVIYSHKDTYVDASGGPTIDMSPDWSAAAVNSGYLKLIAFGRGTGPDANAIIFFTRSGVNSITERVRINSSSLILMGVTLNANSQNIDGAGYITIGNTKALRFLSATAQNRDVVNVSAPGDVYIDSPFTAGLFIRTDTGLIDTLTNRLAISGGVAVSVATWTAITHTGLNITAGADLKVNSVKVVGAQGAVVADATDAASVILRLNELLARCRAHGLIAT